jgi:hypothetical protein
MFSFQSGYLFVHLQKKGSITLFLLAYIDGIIITSSSPQAVDALLADLQAEFGLKILAG